MTDRNRSAAFERDRREGFAGQRARPAWLVEKEPPYAARHQCDGETALSPSGVLEEKNPTYGCVGHTKAPFQTVLRRRLGWNSLTVKFNDPIV
jgi:hypothetical protein